MSKPTKNVIELVLLQHEPQWIEANIDQLVCWATSQYSVDAKQTRAMILQHAKDRKQTKSRGLGDTIRKITTALHIPHCGGCQERQAKLNEMFPYKR
jgi:hypothetical protein